MNITNCQLIISEGGSISSENGSNKTVQIIKVTGIAVGSGVLILGLGICYLWKRKKVKIMWNGKTRQRGIQKVISFMKTNIKFLLILHILFNFSYIVFNTGLSERSHDFMLNEAVILSKRDFSEEVKTDELELPLFDLATIVMATNNFSDANKLGQGGFGCVYKVNYQL